MIDLSIKKLKFHEDMSEETPCFSAELYRDGELIAYVKNSGRGGCNDYVPTNGLTYKDINYLHDDDIDCYIMQLAEDMNFISKNQGKKFILSKGDSFYTITLKASIAKMKKHPNYPTWIKTQIGNFEADGYKVMNTNL